MAVCDAAQDVSMAPTRKRVLKAEMVSVTDGVSKCFNGTDPKEGTES